MMQAHRPRKRFGQNFLKDQHVLNKILSAADLSPGQAVLEIGPGLGALTDRLLATGALLTAIEIDRDLGAKLLERGHDNLQVIIADVLRVDWQDLLPRPPYKLVANLPYNISSQILFKVIDHRHCFNRLVLMFQKEVGDRLLASPGSKDYGVLSVLMQLWFRISRVVRVPPQAFSPPPKVDSVVLQFDRLEQPMTTVNDFSAFCRVVKGAFAQRRKTLRNSLLGAGFSAVSVDQALRDAAIDPARRGETLSIHEFGQLTDRLMESMGDRDV